MKENQKQFQGCFEPGMRLGRDSWETRFQFGWAWFGLQCKTALCYSSELHGSYRPISEG